MNGNFPKGQGCRERSVNARNKAWHAQRHGERQCVGIVDLSGSLIQSRNIILKTMGPKERSVMMTFKFQHNHSIRVMNKLETLTGGHEANLSKEDRCLN